VVLGDAVAFVIIGCFIQSADNFGENNQAATGKTYLLYRIAAKKQLHYA